MTGEQKDVAFTDAQLMAELAAGNVKPLGDLYMRHGETVLRLLGSALPLASTADLEDLCHEAFLKVLRAAPRYREAGKFRAWLFRIALQEARVYRRKKRLHHRLLKRFHKESKVSEYPARAGERNAQLSREQFGEAVAELPEEQREVLALAVGQSMSGKEIAETLGISHNAVRARLHRARKSIYKALETELAATELKGRRR